MLFKNIYKQVNLGNGMDVEELMIKLRRKYERDVKPRLIKKEHGLARVNMADILNRASEHLEEITNKIHFGENYLATAELLLEILKEDYPDEKILTERVREFETYSAQTKLPTLLGLQS